MREWKVLMSENEQHVSEGCFSFKTLARLVLSNTINIMASSYKEHKYTSSRKIIIY
jgi:hypothetical protein